ncbi:MAG: metallophosphoesterase [Patescibacteria group bacterium]|jgi:hypothetical protein
MFLFLIFLVFTIIIIIGSHAFIGFSAVKFFSVPLGKKQFSVYAGLALLSFGFFASAVLLHWFQPSILKTAYYFFSLWTGLAINLILTFSLGWIIIAVFKTSNNGINLKGLGIFLVFLALVSSAYGFWNSGRIKVATVTAEMRDLPDDWSGKTAIQISDVHLGAINRASFAEKIVSLINKEGPDMVFITGDLFDGTCRDFKGLSAPLKRLSAPMGIYFITGNHETYSVLADIKAALSETPLIVQEDGITDLKGVQIAGINYPLEDLRKDISPVLNALDKTRPSILLYHEPVPGYAEEAKIAGVDLMLSGHTHAGQVWPVNFITSLVYKGLDYGLHKDGDFSLYTTSGAGTWGPPMRTTVRPEIVKIKFENLNY